MWKRRHQDKRLLLHGLVSMSIDETVPELKTPNAAVLLYAVVKFALEDDSEPDHAAGDVASRFDLPPGWYSMSEPTVATNTGDGGHYIFLIATCVPPARDGERKHASHRTEIVVRRVGWPFSRQTYNQLLFSDQRTTN